MESDLKKLIVSGWVSKTALAESWNNIFDEYLQNADPIGYKMMLSKMKDVLILKNKMRLALSTLEVLKLKYNKDLVQILRVLGYRYFFDSNDKEKYSKDLEKVARDIERTGKMISEIETGFRSKEKKEVQENDFDKILIRLSKFQGYRIEKDKTTVSEFIELMNDFKEANKPRKDGKQ